MSVPRHYLLRDQGEHLERDPLLVCEGLECRVARRAMSRVSDVEQVEGDPPVHREPPDFFEDPERELLLLLFPRVMGLLQPGTDECQAIGREIVENAVIPQEARRLAPERLPVMELQLAVLQDEVRDELALVEDRQVVVEVVRAQHGEQHDVRPVPGLELLEA